MWPVTTWVLSGENAADVQVVGDAPSEGVDHLTAGRIPHLRGLVVAGRRQEARGVERERRRRLETHAGLHIEAMERLAAGRVPRDQAALPFGRRLIRPGTQLGTELRRRRGRRVGAERKQPSAVGRERDLIGSGRLHAPDLMPARHVPQLDGVVAPREQAGAVRREGDGGGEGLGSLIVRSSLPFAASHSLTLLSTVSRRAPSGEAVTD